MLISIQYIQLYRQYSHLRVECIQPILKQEPQTSITESITVETKPQGVWEIVKVEATAYCGCEKCCGPYHDGKTATGTDAKTKGVAVDPSWISYGTNLYIPNYGYAVADDCGGSIKGKRIDLRFPTHQEALEFGRKEVFLYIWRMQ
jgi:3D (Asp-Asp-Asp) domain-containing protein